MAPPSAEVSPAERKLGRFLMGVGAFLVVVTAVIAAVRGTEPWGSVASGGSFVLIGAGIQTPHDRRALRLALFGAGLAVALAGLFGAFG
jgi:hypothetical protein